MSAFTEFVYKRTVEDGAVLRGQHGAVQTMWSADLDRIYVGRTSLHLVTICTQGTDCVHSHAADCGVLGNGRTCEWTTLFVTPLQRVAEGAVPQRFWTPQTQAAQERLVDDALMPFMAGLYNQWTEDR